MFNVPHLTPIIQRNQQVHFSKAHEMLMETACSHSARAFLELKKNSRKEKHTSPSPQSPPEAKRAFQSPFKDPAFLFFSTGLTSVYPPLAVCFTAVQMPHSSKLPFMHQCLNIEVLTYVLLLQCQSKY